VKRVTAFIGSARKRTTYTAVQEFEKNLKQHGEVDFEYVFLDDYRLEFCQGCKACFDKGEQYCPLKDDRDLLLAKLEQSHGVIFATPSYAFSVSARMKNLIDRFAYVFHRPRFFGKTFTAVVTQGVSFGGGKIRKYLEDTGANLGFCVTKGTCVNTLEPMTDKQVRKLKEAMSNTAARFSKSLNRTELPAPSLFRLMMFRMTRSAIQSAKVRYFDYDYYKEKGWFESDHYYPTNLGSIRKLLGRFFDFLGRKLF
jgi:multimeric flavodoxin WrbA